MLPIAFNPLGLFLEIFFSLTSYRSRVRSDNHAPGLTRLTVRWIILARFLGLWGNLEPLIAKKSSSFSLFVKAIANFGGHTWGTAASPLPPDEEPPFLLSCAVSDVAADLLLFSLWWWWWLLLLEWWWWWWWWRLLLPLLSWATLSGDAIPLTPPLPCPLIGPAVSEFLRMRWWGGGSWGDEGRWRRFKYPLLILLWFAGELVRLGESLSVLTTRRSTRAVVRWAGVAGSVLSLPWTFIHLRRFRFPHCKTKSDGAVCLVASQLDLSSNDDASAPLLPDVLAVPLLLLLLLLLFLKGSLSIRLLNNCDSMKFPTRWLASFTLQPKRKCESETKLQPRSFISQSCLLRLWKNNRVPIDPQSLQQFGFSSNKRQNPFKMHKFASLCKLQNHPQMIIDDTESIGLIRERNLLGNQTHSEFLQLKIPKCIREKKTKTKNKTVTPL